MIRIINGWRSRTRWSLAAGCFLLALVASLSTLNATSSEAAPTLTPYKKARLGDGFVETLYAADGGKRPTALAVRVDGAAMKSLPTTPTHDGKTCFDKDGDGVDLETDCASGHERVLEFPKLEGLPFKWLMFNWQIKGHGPPHVFDQPHFDMHYFIQDLADRNRIRTGPCHLVINCDDEATAMKTVPAPYAPEGWGLPGAAGRMGNHIVDPNAAPANGGPFTQAFAYGTWNGHISFWEPVVNTNWFTETKPEEVCQKVPQTPEVELSGYYPTLMCTRRGSDGSFTFTFEEFAKRTAPKGAKAPDWSTVGKK